MSNISALASGVSATATAIGDALLGDKKGEFTRLGNTSSEIKPEHKVFLLVSYPDGTGYKIEAPAPPNLSLAIQANWTQKNGIGVADMITGATNSSGSGMGKAIGSGVSAALDLAGVKNTTQKILTAHHWDGSSPVQLTIPFEFIALSDPMADVINPVRELYKLTAPLEDDNGILIPPGPSVVGSTVVQGTQVKVLIGTMLTFENVIVDNVSGEIDTRVTKGSGGKARFLHAKIDVSITSFYTVSRSDVDKIFNMET